jgi:hypothetical protein
MSARGESTQLKLEEAKFFLDHLAPNYGKERKFDFFLSAYISAARSVMWVMRAEYADAQDWEEWFKSLEPSKEEAFLLKGTTEIRNRAQKFEPLRTMTQLRVKGLNIPAADRPRVTEALARSGTGQLPAYVGGSLGHYFVEIEVEGERLRFPASTVLFDRNVDEFPDRNIIEVCIAYYAALERWVRQCREKFDA